MLKGQKWSDKAHHKSILYNKNKSNLDQSTMLNYFPFDDITVSILLVAINLTLIYIFVV